MAGSGNPPAVIVQVIIGCITAKAGLWHRGLASPVFFIPRIRIIRKTWAKFTIIFDFFAKCLLKPLYKWYIIPKSMRLYAYATK